MTEAQKDLLLLIGENLVDYLRDKFYQSSRPVDKKNYEDLRNAMSRVEREN